MKTILSYLPADKLERGVVIVFGLAMLGLAIYGIVTGVSALINGEYKTGYVV